MRFIVEKVCRQGDRIMVSGRTPVGPLQGIWQNREPPIVRSGCHVELTIDAPHEAAAPRVCAPATALAGDTVVFHGLCEEADEALYYLRFAADWLEMIDISAISIPRKAGDLISFSAPVDGIKIYPYTL